ncbi:hypothetical protein [Salibacterium aidingense]|uniref:hypothetical protein n=1 Tax=Salibacterium aidingense TaxID=384933 RepID=UPI0003F7B881|nr:hypothetical protein [Salibacterium aidingense]
MLQIDRKVNVEKIRGWLERKEIDKFMNTSEAAHRWELNHETVQQQDQVRSQHRAGINIDIGEV